MIQQLCLAHPARFKQQKGSALVGALGVAIMIGLMAIGYLHVVTSVSNNEEVALSDARAFCAAESGMRLGKGWFCQNENLTASLLKGAAIPDVIPHLFLNGYDVRVDIVKTDGGVAIRSTVACKPILGYTKIVSQEVVPAGAGPSTTYPFTYAGFGKNSVSMSGNGAT